MKCHLYAGMHDTTHSICVFFYWTNVRRRQVLHLARKRNFPWRRDPSEGLVVGREALLFYLPLTDTFRGKSASGSF